MKETDNEKFKDEIIFKERKNYDKYLDFKLATVFRDEKDNKIEKILL